jgi:hypothetical protein
MTKHKQPTLRGLLEQAERAAVKASYYAAAAAIRDILSDLDKTERPADCSCGEGFDPGCPAHVPPQVERQAWPVMKRSAGYAAIGVKGDIEDWILAAVGQGADGWTCVGFAIDDQHRDACVAGDAVALAGLQQVPVRTDGSHYPWAVVARRAGQ